MRGSLQLLQFTLWGMSFMLIKSNKCQTDGRDGRQAIWRQKQIHLLRFMNVREEVAETGLSQFGPKWWTERLPLTDVTFAVDDLHLHPHLPFHPLKCYPKSFLLYDCHYYFQTCLLHFLGPVFKIYLFIHSQVIMPSSHRRISKCPSLFVPTTCTAGSRKAFQKCTPSPCACGSSPVPVRA